MEEANQRLLNQHLSLLKENNTFVYFLFASLVDKCILEDELFYSSFFGYEKTSDLIVRMS